MDEETIEVIEEIDEEEIEVEEEAVQFGRTQEKEVNITQNGTTTLSPDTGYQGISQATINTNVTPNLQDKDVSITENGTTTITKDVGYDGLNNVNVSVSGILDTSDATATANDIVLDKTAYVNGQKITGTAENNCKINTNLSEESPTLVNNIIETPEIYIPTTVTTTNELFTNCYSLVNPKFSNTSHIKQMISMFRNCKSITTINLFDTSSNLNMQHMFNGCTSLVNIPVLDTSMVSTRYGFASTFGNCPNLSNESLNNILQMCINATRYNYVKTLSNMGLNETQKATCQTLSNWSAFTAAGWTA